MPLPNFNSSVFNFISINFQVRHFSQSHRISALTMLSQLNDCMSAKVRVRVQRRIGGASKTIRDSQNICHCELRGDRLNLLFGQKLSQMSNFFVVLDHRA